VKSSKGRPSGLVLRNSPWAALTTFALVPA
jgi:hypothetical protein